MLRMSILGQISNLRHIQPRIAKLAGQGYQIVGSANCRQSAIFAIMLPKNIRVGQKLDVSMSRAFVSSRTRVAQKPDFSSRESIRGRGLSEEKKKK